MKKLLLLFTAIGLSLSLSSFTEGGFTTNDNADNVETQSAKRIYQIYVLKNVYMGQIVAHVVGMDLPKTVWVSGCVQTQECGPGTSEYVDCFSIRLDPGVREACYTLQEMCESSPQWVLDFHYVMLTKSSGDTNDYEIVYY